MKRTLKRSARSALLGTRKVLAKNPRLKAVVKRVLESQLPGRAGVGTYEVWLRKNLPDYIGLVDLKKKSDDLKYRPLISILTPTYNTDLGFLRECFDSVIAQVYDNWELCIIDDASPNSEVRDVITEYAKKDSRIKYKFLKTNYHISGASNEGIKLATGEFVSLLDHDDILWPNALYEVVNALNENKDLDLIYTDEDKITESRFEHLGAFFKPDWNPDFLLSVNYITHFSTIRRVVLEENGGFKEEYNGAQDWDLFLRITSVTPKICHVPKIVYSWRVHELSTAKHTEAKPYVVEAQRKAITAELDRRGYEDAVVEQDAQHKGYWRVTYPVQGNPLISIVIPSKNQLKVVKRCIESIYHKTSYKNFEIILVDTGSTDKAVWRWYKKQQKQHANFHLVEWPEKPFSYASSCNKGAEVTNGELLVMLNNDTEVISPNWLEVMAGDAQRKEIGAVGCLLFFPDKYHIQHAGVGVGLGGVAANSFSMMTLEQKMTQTQHLMLNTKHDMTVVTAACLMIRKKLFMEVGGFDEKFRVSYNDVDLCLRIYEKGLQNLYTPYVRLLHHESISVGLPEELKKRDTVEFKDAKQLFVKRWRKYVEHDPNLNPNLNKDNAFYDV